jgi:HEAT repeat protein
MSDLKSGKAPRKTSKLPARASRAVAKQMLNGLISPDERRRKAARRRVQEMGPAMVPALIEAMRSPNENLRWEAVDSLGAIADPSAARAVLRRVLEDRDVHVRWRAIWAVTCVDDGRVVPALVKALRHRNPTSAWNAAVALSVFGRAEAVPKLLSGTGSPDPFQRWEAVNALGGFKAQGILPALSACLRDAMPDVRREAALALGRTGNRRAGSVLMKALEHDEDPQVRWRAAAALARLGDPAALPRLRRRLKAENDALVKEHIADAIKAARSG